MPSFTAQSIAACINYLYIIYDDEKLNLEEFAKKYSSKDLDQLIEHCKIEYKGTLKSYADCVSEYSAFCESLPFSEKYVQQIYPLEMSLLTGNYDFYKSGKFFNKTENCLQTARNYLIRCARLFDYNQNMNWIYGYGPQFMLRSLDFSSAVIWYNNCYDYILQIAYLAFSLFKLLPNYAQTWTFEETIKKCSYRTMEKICNNNATIPNISILWGILDNCHSAMHDVNEWANYIKHKGGIEIVGLHPEAPFTMQLQDLSGTIIAQNSEFSPISIDMDNAITILKNTHMALYSCLDQLYTFINYPAATLSKDKDGNLVIPDRNSYVRVIVP